MGHVAIAGLPAHRRLVAGRAFVPHGGQTQRTAGPRVAPPRQPPRPRRRRHRLLHVAETDGIQVTAALLRGAVSILPPGRFDPAEAAEQIRAYLTGNPGNQARHNASAVETFTAQTEKMLRTLQRAASRGTLQAAAHADPETVRCMIASVRSILDAIEQEAF